MKRKERNGGVINDKVALDISDYSCCVGSIVCCIACFKGEELEDGPRLGMLF